MADATDPDTYPDTIWYPVERYLPGFAVRDKERLISALISNALLNEPVGFERLTGSGCWLRYYTLKRGLMQ